MISDFRMPIPSAPLIFPRFRTLPFVSVMVSAPSGEIVTFWIPVPSLPSAPFVPSTPSRPSLPFTPSFPSAPSLPTMQPKLTLRRSEKVRTSSFSALIVTSVMPTPSSPSVPFWPSTPSRPSLPAAPVSPFSPVSPFAPSLPTTRPRFAEVPSE